MIKEALELILGLKAPTQVEIGSLTYTDGKLTLVTPPLPSPVSVTTLQAMADLYDGALDGVNAEEVILHVTGPSSVELISKDADEFGRRRVWMRAEHQKVQQFAFGQFLNPEQFIIGLQSSFQPTFIDAHNTARNDLDYVMKKASSITAERITTSADDGISQNVTMNRSVALKETETLKSRVLLAPYRTFPELNQPLSAFAFRATQPREGLVQLALFEADGGHWRIDAVAEIKRWLTTKFDITIVS